MLHDITYRMSLMVRPTIDASARMNGVRCRLYNKVTIPNVTQITGRGEVVGTNSLSFNKLPDFTDVYLLIYNPIKPGYKGAPASATSQPKTESVAAHTELKSYIETYEGQYGISWVRDMKVEVFYRDTATVPEVVYQVSEVQEVPLADNSSVHSGLIHVYLVPFM